MASASAVVEEPTTALVAGVAAHEVGQDGHAGCAVGELLGLAVGGGGGGVGGGHAHAPSEGLCDAGAEAEAAGRLGLRGDVARRHLCRFETFFDGLELGFESRNGEVVC